ncbi:6-phosphogluconolactonase [Zooshikella harenae]|uniref:6-phosphogluconolactonase n=1 Tax=Zooshikella harenae TaxID=2827238 RepID=A0ABS5Z9T8_9GAMM|nr:6-phosphogluconolactonase [Zooshikella harenae]MBU2710653.1 6-phosphogluconolactonase [Zooshikella harenae]
MKTPFEQVLTDVTAKLQHPLLSFSDSEKLVIALTDTISDTLQMSLNARNQATLVVSGGSTPIPLFKKLAAYDLNWANVNVTLADERWVDENHDDSNTQLVKTQLLQKRASAARFIGLKTPAVDIDSGLDSCSTALKQLPQPFDVVILGMGNDGHTASLFPNTTTLKEGLSPATDKLCLSCQPPTAPHQRITLTYPLLSSAKQVILHIAGEDKLLTLQKALAAKNQADMPIRAFLQDPSINFVVYWSP